MINKHAKLALATLAFTALAAAPWFLVRHFGPLIQEKAGQLAPADIAGLQEAMYYEELGGGLVECHLCPNNCLLSKGQTGNCKVRRNIDGKLYSLNYNKPVAVHVDPIEKKPLFHFLPGAKAYSLATVGCNLSCRFCQNWDISQRFPEEADVRERSPAQVVAEAKAAGAEAIAYTYSEPVIFYEYMLDIAKLAREQGLKNVMISAGYINEAPLMALLPHLDGVKIDLKAFDDDFYKKLTNGRLQPVLDTIERIVAEGTHLEIVYLVIPGENDDMEEIKAMAEWLVKTAGPDVPLHFSRFHPQYRMQNKPPTPVDTIRMARQAALDAGLNHVYSGNVDFREGESTYCPDGSLAIERQGYFIKKNRLDQGQCPDGTRLPGVWE